MLGDIVFVGGASEGVEATVALTTITSTRPKGPPKGR